MKKLLCVVLALSAIFCFAGCENGKCDECGAENNGVQVYEHDGEKDELCLKCFGEKAWEGVGDAIFGD